MRNALLNRVYEKLLTEREIDTSVIIRPYQCKKEKILIEKAILSMAILFE